MSTGDWFRWWVCFGYRESLRRIDDQSGSLLDYLEVIGAGRQLENPSAPLHRNSHYMPAQGPK